MDRLSRSRHLWMLAYCRLRRLHRANTPTDPVAAYLEGARALFVKNAARSVRQKALAEGLTARLVQGGVPSMVIKGHRLAADVYQDPDCRSSSDIDILVRRWDVARADRVLREAGFTRVDPTVPLGFWVDRTHHALYIGGTRKPAVELHWAFSVPGFFRMTSADIWGAAVPTEDGQWHLTPEMLLVLLLCHHHRHAFREPRNLVDVLWALHRFADAVDWPAFAGRLGRIGLSTATRVTLHQIRRLWPETGLKGCRRLQAALDFQGTPVPRRLIAHFQMDMASGSAPENIVDAIAFRLALDNRSTILKAFLKTLVPPPRIVQSRFGDGRAWTLPVTYLRYGKWRIDALRRLSA